MHRLHQSIDDSSTTDEFVTRGIDPSFEAVVVREGHGVAHGPGDDGAEPDVIPEVGAVPAGPAVAADFGDVFDDDGDDDGEAAGVNDAADLRPLGDDLESDLQEILGIQGTAEELRDLFPILGVVRENQAMHRDDAVDPDGDDSDGDGLPEAAAGLAPAPVDEPPRETYDELAVRIGWRAGPGWTYSTVEGRLLGFVRFLPSGTSVKVVCRLHLCCSLFVNTDGDFDFACKRLLRWLHHGLGMADQTAHAQSKPMF